MLLVALRKESVDRNQGVHYDNYNLHVALRKESVDRNSSLMKFNWNLIRSLSARRAWIEINYKEVLYMGVTVALRKESVDRNISPHSINSMTHSRSPQGERG